MSAPEQVIARIDSTFLGWEDHGILTAYLRLDYGSASQSTPGYTLDEPDGQRDRVGIAFGMEFVARIMRAVGVDEWGKLKGRTIFALVEGGQVVGIEPLPTERGERFIFRELAEAMAPALARG